MKKLKKTSNDKVNLKIGLFKSEIKCSRLTVNSRVCNIDKFNDLFQIIDSTKDFKNLISNYCFNNLTSLVTNYSGFIKNKLNKDDVYLCARPKQIYYRAIKNIIDEVYKLGVVTELLPKQAINRLHKKEAPSFRAG